MSFIKTISYLNIIELHRTWPNSIKIYHSSSHLRQIKERELKQREIMAKGLPKQQPIKGVKQILIIASGKGGVGKSTTAVNLSVAIKNLAPEKSVGLLDADVFGPSIPLMMNIHESPILNENNFMEPLINYGIKCMSMGFLIEEKSPAIWRGLMVMSALNKLLRHVAWAPLDYLIIDTPPGTGDTHLSLIQNLPITAVLLVTTPQIASLEVTRRGATMFQKLNVPIIGIVENMGSITCPNCSNEVPIHSSRQNNLVTDLGVEILQKIPLFEQISKCSDAGKPIVLTHPNSKPAISYKNLAQQVINALDKHPFQKI